jgi:hypothetical protein
MENPCCQPTPFYTVYCPFYSLAASLHHFARFIAHFIPLSPAHTILHGLLPDDIP